MNPEELHAAHQRYLVQAKWTRTIRESLLADLNVESWDRILEVGSGTGVICHEARRITGARTVAVDLCHPANLAAKAFVPEVDFATADGTTLPFPDDSFGLSFCHFLFLWVVSPASILREMIRVTRPGGWVSAFAEPDYGGRIDYPDELSQLGQAQMQALKQAGADPLVGRKLRALFTSLQLDSVKVGVLGGEWERFPDDETRASEAQTLAQDLKGLMAQSQINRLLQKDLDAWESGERVLFVPTFFALGKVR